MASRRTSSARATRGRGELARAGRVLARMAWSRREQRLLLRLLLERDEFAVEVLAVAAVVRVPARADALRRLMAARAPPPRPWR